MIDISNTVEPISIRKLKKLRKLKKFYIIRSRCNCIVTYYGRGRGCLCLNIAYEHADIPKYPNVFINKKILDSNQTFTNRHDVYTESIDHIIVKTDTMYSFGEHLYESDITFYAVFSSKGEYLKWKLKS